MRSRSGGDAAAAAQLPGPAGSRDPGGRAEGEQRPPGPAAPGCPARFPGYRPRGGGGLEREWYLLVFARL